MCIMFFALLVCQAVYAVDDVSTKDLIVHAQSEQKPMTDEEKTDHIENVIKSSFAKIFAGIINALQNPKQKAQHVADCINAMLNIIWEATRDKKLNEREEVLQVISDICDSIEDQEVAAEIKKVIQEHHESKLEQIK